MSFFTYLKDNLRLAAFYGFTLLFICLMMYFDRNNRMLNSNVLYVAIIYTLAFIIFLLADYFIKNSYLKKLLALRGSKDNTPLLPEPLEYKDSIYSSMMMNMYESYLENIKDLENAFKDNSEFMTSWVHEIKTPLTTSKLILDDTPVDVSSLKEEIDRIDDYVEKVLYYSRSDSFSKDYVISEINLNSLMKESIKKHSLLFIKKHIKLVNDCPEDFVVDSDKKWLLFIINQVLSNSLKYTHDNGSISFEITENNMEKLLIISDTGIGIKPEDIKRIFTKAFTGYNGRNENLKATGIGLYLANKLCKKLGHSITLESTVDAGTKVYIHFPKWNDYYQVTKM
ncbi:sensor histidine kinase [Clostridium sp. 19966]|uniref:sensor histidine kinase n=1 Tax=Clostridium sp. 19966 TaxID=2768166 RepID=UPI0028DFBB89|nr:sensor histidine kinase [Clostridium sp. 19966]MDT8718551.1 sensor histidine kinase [Clostridium sp. 19966]